MTPFIFALVFLLLSGCSASKEKNEPKAIVKVERRDIKKEILATGAVKPKVGAQVKVGSRISGKLERLFVQVGDKVKKGDLIAIVEHKDLQARVERLKASLFGLKIRKKKDLDEIAHKIKELEAKLALARLELKRYTALYAKNYVSKDAVDQAQRDVKVLEAQLEATKSKYEATKTKYEQEIAETEAELKEAEVRLSYAFIRAPISGTVSSVTTQQGETVVAGLNAPTFITIIDLSRLQVDAYVDETDIGQIKPGQEVRFTVDAFADKIFKGKVITVYPGAILRENVVYYDVAIDITTPYEGLLRPEMTANVIIVVGMKKNVLAAPDRALRMDIKGKSYVMVKGTKGWQKRYVVTGWSSSGYTEIVKGLKEGENIALW